MDRLIERKSTFSPWLYGEAFDSAVVGLFSFPLFVRTSFWVFAFPSKIRSFDFRRRIRFGGKTLNVELGNLKIVRSGGSWRELMWLDVVGWSWMASTRNGSARVGQRGLVWTIDGHYGHKLGSITYTDIQTCTQYRRNEIVRWGGKIDEKSMAALLNPKRVVRFFHMGCHSGP